MMSRAPLPFEIYQITPHLFQAGGIPEPRDRTLRLFDVIVDLAGENRLPNIPDTPDETLYIRWHITDGPLPPPRSDAFYARLDLLIDFLSDAMSEDGLRILVHCGAGINRSSLVTGLVLARTLTGKEAVAQVRHMRPGALTNDSFVRYIESYGQ